MERRMFDEPTTLAAAHTLVAASEEDGETPDSSFHEGSVAGKHILGADLLFLIIAIAHTVN